MSSYDWYEPVYNDVEREHAADRAEARDQARQDEVREFLDQASSEELAEYVEARPRWWRR